MPDSNRKVKGTLHWLSCAHCLPAEVRLYDRLWKVANPRDEMAKIREEKNCSALDAMKEIINPDSLQILTSCYVEKFLANAKPLDYLQFQRIGYFNVDKDSTADKLIFNRTVYLKKLFTAFKKFGFVIGRVFAELDINIVGVGINVGVAALGAKGVNYLFGNAVGIAKNVYCPFIGQFVKKNTVHKHGRRACFKTLGHFPRRAVGTGGCKRKIHSPVDKAVNCVAGKVAKLCAVAKKRSVKVGYIKGFH